MFSNRICVLGSIYSSRYNKTNRSSQDGGKDLPMFLGKNAFFLSLFHCEATEFRRMELAVIVNQRLYGYSISLLRNKNMFQRVVSLLALDLLTAYQLQKQTLKLLAVYVINCSMYVLQRIGFITPVSLYRLQNKKHCLKTAQFLAVI